MGVGGGIFLVTLGAILAFAVKVNVWWLNVRVVGFVLMVAGVGILLLTLWFWRVRRKRGVVSVVEETKLTHGTGAVPPDPPDVDVRNPPHIP
jgi:Domain of unknown function (DUF6458)